MATSYIEPRAEDDVADLFAYQLDFGDAKAHR